jgi:hypothetical protein
MSKYILAFQYNHKLEGEEFSFARDLCEGSTVCILGIEYTVSKIEFDIVDEYIMGSIKYKSKTYLWLS